MPAEMTGLTNVGRIQAKHAAETLARAFYEYPLLKYYYPDNKKREKITYYFVASSVFSGTRYGEVYTTSVNMEGVAVWVSSERYPKSMMDSIRSIPLSISYGLFRHGVYKMKAVGDHIDSVKERLAPARHMFLQTLGVDPNHQGKGYAGKLLKPMLARLDEEKIPCYLETLDEKNVRLYEHFGFKPLDESVIPGTPLKSWAMLREPGI
ncbi:MAG TPA: GNAT family N-acetyltransferase [Dehalococcoidia bacterium]|nr:GNAT family N-acetyltransferase [Dehalococcoidia bacterium]